MGWWQKTGSKKRRHRSSGFLSRWAQARNANVAVIFALAMLPMMVCAGTAVDLSRALLVRARLSQALDAAGLAVGGAVALDQAGLEQLAQDFFAANYPASEIGVPGNLTVSVNGQVISLAATAELNTTLMELVGIHTLSVGAESEITRETKGLEVVMVLDVTGSMGSNGKLQAMKDAANELVDILFGDEAEPDKLKVGIVPFAASVRLNPVQSVNNGWIDTNGSSSQARTNFDGSVPNNFGYAMYTEYMNSTDWRGCVEWRPGTLDMTDTPPGTGDTRWVPYFSPDSPDNSWASPDFPNSYTNDGGSGNALTRQRRSSKYVGQTENGWSRSPHRQCVASEILPLTNTRSTVEDVIDGLTASGHTHIPVGISWGWKVLSPTEPYTEGEAYDHVEYDKAMIVLTDGANTMPGSSNGTINDSDYTAFGFAEQERLGPGINRTWEMADEMDDMVEELCESVKDEGIRVYTITFQLNSTNLQNIFRACASEEQLYFNSPTNSELQTVFQTIAQDLSNLRVSK